MPRFDYSKAAVAVLYAALVVVLAVATFVERAQGTGFAERSIYHSWWFCGLWGAWAVATVVACIRCRWWRKQWPVLLLHGSFLVILAGALTTFVTGKKGYVHLAVGGEADSFVEQGSGARQSLPFVIGLDSFRVEHYPGTEAPADYVSHVRFRPHGGGDSAAVAAIISMNRIAVHGGYRFYQASYDEGGGGSWLSVNHDPWGIGLTYAGYALLGLSMLWVLLARGGGFRRLWRHPLLRRGGLLAACLCLGTAGAGAQQRSLPALPRHSADSLARVQVVYNDRVVPFNTLARDFVTKLYGRPDYGNLTPEQVVSGWLLRPDVWKDEPMLRIKSAELRRRLGIDGPCARLSDLLDGQRYRLDEWVKPGSQPPALVKAALEADEKVGLVLMLTGGTLIRPLPADGSVPPLSPARVEAELLYNRVPFARILFMACLAMGLLALIAEVMRLGKPDRATASARRRGRLWRRVCLGAMAAAFAALTFCGALRWVASGNIPMSNGYETMLLMAWFVMLMSMVAARRFSMALTLGFITAGFFLLVAHIGQMDPAITGIMPVLDSPLLSLHVAAVMLAFALLALTFACGVAALAAAAARRLCGFGGAGGQEAALQLLSRLLLYPALAALAMGTFIGAVWANVSWGRYWGWDAKETWALITLMVYAVAVHTDTIPALRRPLCYHAFMVAAFLTILMTYFGVNYLLGSGLHTYA